MFVTLQRLRVQVLLKDLAFVICHHKIFFASHTAFDLFEFKPTMDKLNY
jgi:hypothetical protein